MMSRLTSVAGEWIDRTQTLAFEFEGQRYRGFAGDTITSALCASGVQVLGRSFKYHRPRGVLSFANHDVNALVADGQSLNVRADVTPLIDGMRLNAVNTSGGLLNDRGQLLDRLSAFLPVGFYYKTFFRPKWTFACWERLIRRLSGLGSINFASPRLRTAKRYDFSEVLVIGAGPAGMSAALAAARGGARVLLVDENQRMGGSLTYAIGAEARASELLTDLQREIQSHPNIRVCLATAAVGSYADGWIALVDEHKMTKVRAGALIVATGAFEQPAVFRNNDLPGVMLASAAQRLIYRYSVKPAQRALVVIANAEGYAAALDLRSAGVDIAAVVDLRTEADRSVVAETVRRQGVAVMQGSCIYEATSNSSIAGVQAASVCPLTFDGKPDLSARQEITIDGIVMSVGFAPANTLLLQAGCTVRFDEPTQQFVPDRLAPGMFAAGRVNGAQDLDDRLRDGERAAHAALMHIGIAQKANLDTASTASRCPSHPYPIIEHPDGKNFVDFDEDLQVKDFSHAAQEGFDNVELLKRYTTVGMGPSQGKHSNLNAVRILAKLRGEAVGNVGTTTARPFHHPVPLSHLAGRGFTPERRTPLHSSHVRAGAVMMQTGVWMRPEYYARPGKSKETAVFDEATAVRRSAGIIDVGTLGKIELSGPDAGELLERCYTGRFKNLKIGMTRYAVMLDEAGVVIDDGVVARLAEDRFYFTTTSTGSANVYRELQRWIALWRLKCGIVNVTGAMAALNLAGPRSREILQPLTDFDLSGDAFAYLAVREGKISGVTARALRAGFVGELGYEIHIPAESAPYVWDTLIEAGARFDIVPFGVEAQRLLRLEKGHIIIGQDTDGLTTPREASLNWAIKMDKPFFVGQRSLKAIERRPLKHQLAGFALPASFTGATPKEGHLVIRRGDIAGRVTSISYSPTLGRHIGLAMLAPDLAVAGTRLSIRTDGGTMLEAKVVALPFYDPEGKRQKLASPATIQHEALPA